MADLASMTDDEKQAFYRDARYTNTYDGVWQSVGKCVFCDLKDDYIVFEENGIVLTITLFAYIDGQMMIIPRRHVCSVKELTPEEWETVRKFMYIAKKIIRKTHGIKGLQIIQRYGVEANSTVEHIHFHCIPFDSPDLCTWNYRKLKNTPKENTAKYREISDEINKLSKRFDKKYAN